MDLFCLVSFVRDYTLFVNKMSRNKVYMNAVAYKRTEREKLFDEHMDKICGIRPLDGTNLAWIYDRDEKKTKQVGKGKLHVKRSTVARSK